MPAATKQLTAADLGLSNPNQKIPVIVRGTMDIKGLDKLRAEVLSDRRIKYTHNKAVEYCELPIFAGEREVGDRHVQFLYDEMRKDTFNWLLVILASAIFEDITYKINGQHTSWALLNMPESYVPEVREVKFRVDSRDQLKLLYSTFDRLKARSDGHISKVLLADTPAAEGVYTSILSALAQGLKFWYIDSEAERRRTTPEQVMALATRDYAPLFRAVGLFAQEHISTCKWVTRIPVVAAMFATFHKSAKIAPEFWKPVLDGLGLTSQTDARWKLRTLLQEMAGVGHVRGSSRKARRDRIGIDAESVYRICVSSWNKWRKGEEVKVLIPTGSRVRPN